MRSRGMSGTFPAYSKMPKPHSGESPKNYLARFMSSPEAMNSFSDPKQRAAVAYSYLRRRKKNKRKAK